MLNKEIQNTVDIYLEVFAQARKQLGNDQAAALIVQEVAKDRRTAVGGSEQIQKGQPATPQQVNFLQRLGIEFPLSVSKQEASALIDRAVTRQREGSSEERVEMDNDVPLSMPRRIP